MKVGKVYIGRQEITILIVLFDLLLLFFYRLYLLTYLVPLNVEYKKLKNRTELIHKENLYLHNEILYHKALTTIEEKARKQGFIDASYYYIK